MPRARPPRGSRAWERRPAEARPQPPAGPAWPGRVGAQPRGCSRSYTQKKQTKPALLSHQGPWLRVAPGPWPVRAAGRVTAPAPSAEHALLPGSGRLGVRLGPELSPLALRLPFPPAKEGTRGCRPHRRLLQTGPARSAAEGAGCGREGHGVRTERAGGGSGEAGRREGRGAGRLRSPGYLPPGPRRSGRRWARGRAPGPAGTWRAARPAPGGRAPGARRPESGSGGGPGAARGAGETPRPRRPGRPEARPRRPRRGRARAPSRRARSAARGPCRRLGARRPPGSRVRSPRGL